MSPLEEERLREISEHLENISDTQNKILDKQSKIEDRLEKAEKITDPALQLAARIGNKFANVIAYGLIIGLLTFLVWMLDKIGVMKLAKLFR